MLNVLSQGTCAQIYAQALEDEPSFNAMRLVKIWHNADTPSLVRGILPKYQYDNDYFVSFESPISFKIFCEQFSASEYNNPQLYKMMNHNCANAALFALHLANIELDLPITRWGRFFAPSLALRVPNKTLTPLTLFDAAKKFKTQQIQNESSTHQFSQIIEKLSHQIKAEPSSKVHDQTQIIVKESIRRAKKRPHHLKSYINVLEATSTILLHESTDQQIKDYQSQAFFFRHRINSISAVYIGCAIDVLLLLQINRWLMLLTNLESEYSHLTDIAAFLLITKGVISLVLALHNHSNTQSKNTQLSSAMVEFYQAFFEKTFVIHEEKECPYEGIDSKNNLIPIEHPYDKTLRA